MQTADLDMADHLRNSENDRKSKPAPAAQEHSPIPWAVYDDHPEHSVYHIAGNGEDPALGAAYISRYSEPRLAARHYANAQLIVRAVNSHSKLVEALEGLLLIVNSQPWGSTWPGRPHAQADAAAAALSAAKAEA